MEEQELDTNIIYVTDSNIEKYLTGQITWENLESSSENYKNKEFAIIKGKDNEDTQQKAEALLARHLLEQEKEIICNVLHKTKHILNQN